MFDALHAARALERPFAAYGISATADQFFHIKSSAPPSCLNWTVFKVHAMTRQLPGIARGVIQVTDRKMDRVHTAVRIANHKATIGSVR